MKVKVKEVWETNSGIDAFLMLLKLMKVSYNHFLFIILEYLWSKKILPTDIPSSY